MENKEIKDGNFEAVYEHNRKVAAFKASTTRSAVDELDLEENMATWFDGMSDSGYSRETIFKAGYQQRIIDEQKLIGEEIAKLKQYIKSAKGMFTSKNQIRLDTLTDLLTKLNKEL